MPDKSKILSLPLIQPSQAQKHVTMNEALRLLDVMVQLSVQDRTRTAPPAAPATGARHIVAPGATGAWAGQARRVALWEGTAWAFFAPLTGWRAHIAAEAALATFDGVTWVTIADAPLLVGQLGVAASPDSTNRVAVSSPAILLNHAGAGHQVKINKAAATDTASLLFQTGFSGRAEMGTAGSDDFAIKVSANGSTYAEAVSVAAATGIVSMAQGMRLPAGTLAAPAMAFAADSDTGLTNPAANQIGFVAGGGQRAVLGDAALQVDVPVTGTAVTQTTTDTTAGRLVKVRDSASVLAQVAALSVLGNAGSAIGDIAALPAAADHQVMRRNGTALGFGAVNLAQAAAVTGVLSPANGGTGVVNNAASTITRTGAHALTLTTTAVSSVTLPVAGTLATLAGVETLTGKTLTAPVINTSITGTAVVASATDVTAGRLLTTGAGEAQAFRRGNVLGVVTQAGTVPTGALIEQGSNANGRYVRFADGTQLCWHSLLALPAATTAAGSIFVGNEATWTFPITFVATPEVSGSVNAATPRWLNARGGSATTALVRVFSPVTDVATPAADLMAVGRWF